MPTNEDGMLIRQILCQNQRDAFDVSEIVEIVIGSSKSRLFSAHEGKIHVCKFGGLEGLFRKDIEASRLYGRRLCDEVKVEFQCGGFFTSDELPRYGISRVKTRELFIQMNKTVGDGDLLVLLAYHYVLADRIRVFLIARFAEELKD